MHSRPAGQAVTKDFTATGELPAVELADGRHPMRRPGERHAGLRLRLVGRRQVLELVGRGNGDTTLLVRAPDGSFLCADDADGSRNLNPLLAITKPAAGRYLVWVGRVDPSKPVTGTLTLTEAADAKPKVLKKQ